MNQDLASKRNIVFPAQSSSRKGFTLIELAFVLVIVGLLLGLGAQLIPMLVTQNKLSDDRTRVKEAKTALIGYALATGRLPFASLSTNGLETPNQYNGYLPWSTIGITGVDAFQTTLFYAVDFNLTTAGSVTQTVIGKLISDTPPLPPNQKLYSDLGAVRVAFVVISAGQNRILNNPPNNINGNTFAAPSAPVTSNYDDILESESLSLLNGIAPP